MVQEKVSHASAALVLLAVMSAAVPPMGFGGFPGLGFSLGGPLGGPVGVQPGQSYSCGASFGACAREREEPVMKYSSEPTMLTGVSRALDQATGKIEGMLAVIKDPSLNTNNQGSDYKKGFGNNFGAFKGFGGLGGMHGGFGAFGGFGGMKPGLMGALGAFGAYGRQQAPRLDLTLEVQIRPLPKALDVVLVFTSAVDQDVCTPESLGSVLTRPETGGSSHYGYGASMLMPHGGMGLGWGSGSLEKDYGVIAQLTVQGGSNVFKITGLGEFTKYADLAGRSAALCEDVVMTMDHKIMCTGKTFGVLFCAKLGFAVEAPPMIPPAAAAAGVHGQAAGPY